MDGTFLIVSFDRAITYNNAELSGFYACCGPDQACTDSAMAGDWPAVRQSLVQHATAQKIYREHMRDKYTRKLRSLGWSYTMKQFKTKCKSDRKASKGEIQAIKIDGFKKVRH